MESGVVGSSQGRWVMGGGHGDWGMAGWGGRKGGRMEGEEVRKNGGWGVCVVWWGGQVVARKLGAGWRGGSGGWCLWFLFVPFFHFSFSFLFFFFVYSVSMSFFFFVLSNFSWSRFLCLNFLPFCFAFLSIKTGGRFLRLRCLKPVEGLL